MSEKCSIFSFSAGHNNYKNLGYFWMRHGLH